MGLALFNYESGNGAFPPACKSINLTVSPPAIQFPDTGFSTQARLLAYIERSTLYNALNFSYEYNDASGGNFTGSSAASNVYICPSGNRRGTRDTVADDPNGLALRKDPEQRLRVHGLRPVGLHRHQRREWRPCHRWTRARRRSSPIATRTLAAKGLLKDGKTTISEIIDGTSNTIAIIECAGRDERFVSQYFEGLYPVVRGQGPAGRRRRRRAPPSGAGPIRAAPSALRASPTTRGSRPTRECPGPHRRHGG